MQCRVRVRLSLPARVSVRVNTEDLFNYHSLGLNQKYVKTRGSL